MKTFYTILASLVAGLVCVQSVSAVEFYKGRPESEKKEKKAGTDRYLVTLKVVDEDGDPISGAVIMIKGSSSGTVTGVDGKGFLMCVPGTDVLEVSQIGYRTESVKLVNDNYEYTVALTGSPEEAVKGSDLEVPQGTQDNELVLSLGSPDVRVRSSSVNLEKYNGKHPKELEFQLLCRDLQFGNRLPEAEKTKAQIKLNRIIKKMQTKTIFGGRDFRKAIADAMESDEYAELKTLVYGSAE